MLNSEYEQRLTAVLDYIEDDIRQWILLDIKAFNIDLKNEFLR